jgi:hypothetical protein
MTTTTGVNWVDISSVNTNYLTITDAASTYLTITDATNTYVDITSDQTITGSKTFNTIYLNSYVYDSIGSAGTDNQLLITTSTGVQWIPRINY